jgi:hypothetical protein
MGLGEQARRRVVDWAAAVRRVVAGDSEGARQVIFQEPTAELYARKVGETQRELQARERERRRLVGIVDQGFINLEISRAGGDEAEVARRGAVIESSAAEHRDELYRLSVEILKLQDQLLYYRQLEALHADGTIAYN